MLLKQLIYLDALAREKHFQRAADLCHITQPSLSAALNNLEQELGVIIIERGHRFEKLTAEGEMILDHARRIIHEMNSIKKTLDELKNGVTGQLRIGAIPTALPMVAHITKPFTARFPAVKLKILSMTSSMIDKSLENYDIDVGITYLDNEPLQNVIPKPLYQESYLLLLQSDSVLAEASTISWNEAAELNLCLLTADNQNRRIIDGIFRSIGKSPVPVMETNSIFNLCNHASLNGMCSIVSRQLVEFFGLPNNTKALPLVQPDVSHTIGLVMSNRHPISALAEKMMAMSSLIDSAEALVFQHGLSEH
jgi:DNA-binding transcriptional LysR family regulator